MENPARDLVVLLVLDRFARDCQVGSITTPPNRTAKTKHFCGDLQSIQIQISGGIQEIFFTDCDFVFGTRMSHFGSKLFGELGEVWGEFEVACPFRLCNRAIAKTQTTMNATYALIATSKRFHGFITIFSRITRIWTA